MKHIWIVMLSTMMFFSVFVSANIVGSWKIDKERTIKANKKVDEAGLKMFERMDIYNNHTVEIKVVGLKSKWKKSKKAYSMTVLGDVYPITLLDKNHLKVKLQDTVHYTRMSKKVIKQASVKQSEVRFQIGKIYRSKIKDDYAFILLSKDRVMYFLQTDRKKKISTKEIIAGALKAQKKKKGFYFADNTVYELKNGNPYIIMEDKMVKILNAKELKYRGNVYVLQK